MLANDERRTTDEEGELFEHPAGVFSSCPRRASHRSSPLPKWFFRSLLDVGVGSVNTWHSPFTGLQVTILIYLEARSLYIRVSAGHSGSFSALRVNGGRKAATIVSVR
jgi:hypothetical protein